MQAVTFESLLHLVVVPVVLNGAERRFVLDSGIGLTLVRDSSGGCRPQGHAFTGRRMSGQELSIPLATADTLAFAGVEHECPTVGLLDMSGFPPDFDDIDGFLSLTPLAGQPFTVDYERRVVRDGSGAEGDAIPVRLDRDGPSLTAFMPLTIPGGEQIEAEVDMGSDSLILDERYAVAAGVWLEGDAVRRVEGTDETGNPFTRSFTRIKGAVYPAGSPRLAQHDAEVMFQRIIHDGLVGNDFLSRFTVTWDLPRSRLLLAPRCD